MKPSRVETLRLLQRVARVRETQVTTKHASAQAREQVKQQCVAAHERQSQELGRTLSAVQAKTPIDIARWQLLTVIVDEASRRLATETQALEELRLERQRLLAEVAARAGERRRVDEKHDVAAAAARRALESRSEAERGEDWLASMRRGDAT